MRDECVFVFAKRIGLNWIELLLYLSCVLFSIFHSFVLSSFLSFFRSFVLSTLYVVLLVASEIFITFFFFVCFCFSFSLLHILAALRTTIYYYFYYLLPATCYLLPLYLAPPLNYTTTRRKYNNNNNNNNIKPYIYISAPIPIPTYNECHIINKLSRCIVVYIHTSITYFM
jgi:hypothetical protein